MPLRQQIWEALEPLSPQEKDVINLRLGLDTGYPLTRFEVEKRLSIPSDGIRQIEQKAFTLLRSLAS